MGPGLSTVPHSLQRGGGSVDDLTNQTQGPEPGINTSFSACSSASGKR